jgi:hypothetical protein
LKALFILVKAFVKKRDFLGRGEKSDMGLKEVICKEK